MLIGKLTSGERQKIMTICTIDVHARDVVGKVIAQKVSEVSIELQYLLWTIDNCV